ncbi:MAG: hypothetical protein CRN43_17180 [Candidatus Nephrothrix sp. EaCA]|nr:MAG: hypothetical protein CRN43_17180 [Candidatus Nephrothrix sp. EaCA]
MRSKIDYGIDLGTASSAIARMENGTPLIKKTGMLSRGLKSIFHGLKLVWQIVGKIIIYLFCGAIFLLLIILGFWAFEIFRAILDIAVGIAVGGVISFFVIKEMIKKAFGKDK